MEASRSVPPCNARWHRARRAMAALLLAMAAIPGCGAPAEPPPGELRLNLGTEPPTLDWNLATDTVSLLVIEQLMRGLTRLGPDLRPVPALAERWDVSPDGRTYTFHLRRDVVWTDGVALRAEHFVDGWRRLLAPATAAEYAYFLFDVENARAYHAGELDDPSALGVRALDAHTLEVRLVDALVSFPALVSFAVTYPVRLDCIEAHGDAWTDPGRLVSLGPFRLEQWRHEYRIALGANPAYYAGPPGVRRIVGYMVGEEATALALFEQGRLDLVRLPPLEIRRYEGTSRHRTVAGLRGYYYGFDVSSPPFDDARVRRAFAMAIDRSELPRILRGGEIPATSWIPPGMPHHDPAIGLGFDPGRARALLAEAGIDPAQLAPIRVGYNADQTNRLVAERIQAQWREHLGVRVELEGREWKAFLRELAVDPPPVFRMGWGADYPDPDSFMDLFTSGSANNFTRWSDARYDELVARAARERDPARRRALYDDAQRILCEEEVPIVPLFVASYHYAVSDRVEGFAPNAMDLLFLDEVRVR